ncbi:MAG: DUF3348 family protein, partial [Hydrogenophaga sp.]|nr:DUF3348 family protein [Hydrogenophaga sp.]
MRLWGAKECFFAQQFQPLSPGAPARRLAGRACGRAAQDLAERLGQWFNVADAIALSAAHQ